MGRKALAGAGAQHQGGGGFDDVDVEIVEAQVSTYDLTNRTTGKTYEGIVGCVLVYENVENSEVRFTERYSAGGIVVPSEDGTCFEFRDSVDADVTGIADNTRWGIFSQHLRTAGVPDELYNVDVKQLVGLKGHLRRVEVDKMKVPVITKLISLPGGGEAAADDDEVVATATKLVLAATAKYGELTKAELGKKANKALKGKPLQAEVAAKVLDGKFLERENGWSFDGRKVTKADGGELGDI